MATKFQHKEYLQKVEDKLKSDRRLFREDIANCVNALKYKNMSVDEKKEAITDMIKRTGIKIIGHSTMYTPRTDWKEKDKTMDWLDDFESYYNFDK